MDQSHQIDADYNQFINELVGIFHEKWLERCPGSMPLNSDLLLDIGEKIESIVNYADENATTQEEAKNMAGKVDELECTLEDEQAAHRETLSMLEIARGQLNDKDKEIKILRNRIDKLFLGNKKSAEEKEKLLEDQAQEIAILQLKNEKLKTELDASVFLLKRNQEQDAKVKKIIEVLKSGQAWLVDPNTGLRLAEALDRVAIPQAAEPVTCVNCESWKRLYQSLESQHSELSLLRKDEHKAHQVALDQKNSRINEHMQSITDLNNKLQIALNKIAMHEQANKTS